MLIPPYNSPKVQAANERLIAQTKAMMEETENNLAQKQRAAAARFGQGFTDREHAFRSGAEWQSLYPDGDKYLFVNK